MRSKMEAEGRDAEECELILRFFEHVQITGNSTDAMVRAPRPLRRRFLRLAPHRSLALPRSPQAKFSVHERGKMSAIMHRDFNNMGMPMPEYTERTPDVVDMSSPIMEDLLHRLMGVATHRIEVRRSTGAADSCVKNCRAVLAEHGGELVKGFKVFLSRQRERVVGALALIHFVVRFSDVTLVDPTPSFDDVEVLFVESPTLYKRYTESEITMDGVQHGAVVLGDEEFMEVRTRLDGGLVFRDVHECKPKVLIQNQMGEVEAIDVIALRPAPGTGKNAKSNKKKREKQREKKNTERVGDGV